MGGPAAICPRPASTHTVTLATSPVFPQDDRNMDSPSSFTMWGNTDRSSAPEYVHLQGLWRIILPCGAHTRIGFVDQFDCHQWAGAASSSAQYPALCRNFSHL